MVVYWVRRCNYIGAISWAICSDGNVVQGRQDNGFEPDTAATENGPCTSGLALGHQQYDYSRLDFGGYQSS